MSSDPDNANFVRPHDGTLAVHLLGLVDYSSVLGLQEYLIYELSGCNDASGMLLICEHPPTISMGREATRRDLRIDGNDREFRELPVHWVSRGGGAFTHAPGQLALYLLVPLRKLQLGLAEFQRLFEQSVLATCRELKIPSKRRDGEPGLWSRGGQLAYFGASVRSWITCHGMFLNVTVDRRFLELTMPNPVGERSTTMQSQRLRPVSMSQVRESLIRHLSDGFGYEMADVSTGHPLLTRTTQRVLIHA
jgi:lipoyl(octanoyl) transferase